MCLSLVDRKLNLIYWVWLFCKIYEMGRRYSKGILYICGFKRIVNLYILRLLILGFWFNLLLES